MLSMKKYFTVVLLGLILKGSSQEIPDVKLGGWMCCEIVY